MLKCCGCGGCEWGDCISNTEIESGCCHACDTLVLWCKRPAVGITQHYTLGIPVHCETCYTESFAEMEPVQAIYKYYKNYYRCVFPGVGGIISLAEDYPQEPCPDPTCYPGYTDCCATAFPSSDCQCNFFIAGLGGLSSWRREQLWANDANKWFVESICYKGGAALGGSSSLPRLSDQLLCIVYFERWWKIAEDCGAAKIVVPDCPDGNCGGVPYQTDDLVPKWWIYACSGIPLYDFEIDDAVRFSVITSGEASELRADIAIKKQPSQVILAKMAVAGYLRAADWRQEQRQAYIDLNARFSGAGYSSCIQNVADMHTLGPFRKRLTNPTVGTSTTAILKKGEVISEAAALQADCFINYAGSGSSQTDYDYWSERQWVYFRGVPGGWTWVGWHAQTDSVCAGAGFTEDEAILNGCGRNDQTCIAAFQGNPRPNPTCSPCGTINSALTPCNHCTGGCDSCGVSLASSCADGNLPVPTKCKNFMVSASCEGIRFVYAEYRIRNSYVPDGAGGFELQTKYVCYNTVASYLTEVKRSVNSWADSIPFMCRAESPPLHANGSYPVIEGGHVGIFGICNPLSQGDFSKYTNADLCCGGICYTEPCWKIDGLRNNCGADTECPPFDTKPQIGCIGQPIVCP